MTLATARPTMTIGTRAVLAALAALGGTDRAQADSPPERTTLPDVVSVGYLSGTAVPLTAVPANVQTLDARQLGIDRAGDVATALDRAAGSVGLNDTQGNPFQADVTFRGFTASPILGTPQGVSVVVDGVRVNEAFGDVVNWDLIPQSALETLTVIPGTDPVFGLNTLGGALVLTTKRGFTTPGTAFEVAGGSFGRRRVELESGGHGERFDGYVAASGYDDDGWALHNSSRVEQGFAKVGYRDGPTDATLSVTYADNRLEGSQALPRSFLDDATQSYTWPDVQSNRLVFVVANVSHDLGAAWTANATAYYRDLASAILNSNVNDEYSPDAEIGPGNQPTGNAIEDVEQSQRGLTLQAVRRGAVGSRENTLLLAANVDRGRTAFAQYDQEAGADRDTTSDEPLELTTRLDAATTSTGLAVADTLALTPGTYLTLAARYDRAEVTLEDRLGTALNGHHRFSRLQPSIGLTFNPHEHLTLYGNAAQGMRVPTPVELTCADPAAPCSLPNAFGADPPLDPVIARTLEVGARGTLTGLRCSAALFLTRLDDDIQFIASGSGSGNSGYFRNVGRTHRAGLELALETVGSRLQASVRYTYLQATYRTPFVVNSPFNSEAAPLECPTCADVQVQTGDRIPGVPLHVVRVRADYAWQRAGLGVGLTAQSRQYARGDPNNADVNGPVPGMAVASGDGYLELSSRLRLYARVDNLLDRQYSNFGLLGHNVFTAPGGTFDPTGTTWRSEQFRSVSAPRSFWIGLRYRT